MVVDQDPALFDKLSTADKLQLIADTKTIRYTMDVENQMIEENFYFIKYVATRLKVREFTDEHLSYGMMGMRKAIYYYTKEDIKFSTFCYNGIKTAFKHLYYFTKPKKTRANNAILATDMRHDNKDAKMEDLAVYHCVSEDESQEDIELCGIDTINQLCKEAGLNDLQVNLIKAFLTKKNVPNWLENFMFVNKLTCTRQAVYTRLKRSIRKLKDAYDRKKSS